MLTVHLWVLIQWLFIDPGAGNGSADKRFLKIRRKTMVYQWKSLYRFLFSPTAMVIT